MKRHHFEVVCLLLCCSFIWLTCKASLIFAVWMNGVSASADATVIMAIPSFHLFRNGPVSYVKIEWKVTKPTVSVRNKFTSTRLFKIIPYNVYKSVKFKKVVHVLHDVQYNYVFHNINNINLHVEINGYIKVMHVCHLY